MATFQFDLVSPEKLVFSGEVEQVDVPGSEGDFGVLAHHAPLIAMLKPGILSILSPSDFFVILPMMRMFTPAFARSLSSAIICLSLIFIS